MGAEEQRGNILLEIGVYYTSSCVWMVVVGQISRKASRRLDLWTNWGWGNMLQSPRLWDAWSRMAVRGQWYAQEARVGAIYRAE